MLSPLPTSPSPPCGSPTGVQPLEVGLLVAGPCLEAFASCLVTAQPKHRSAVHHAAALHIATQSTLQVLSTPSAQVIPVLALGPDALGRVQRNHRGAEESQCFSPCVQGSSGEGQHPVPALELGAFMVLMVRNSTAWVP